MSSTIIDFFHGYEEEIPHYVMRIRSMNNQIICTTGNSIDNHGVTISNTSRFNGGGGIIRI